MLLAVIVLPLILRTLYLAWFGHYARHRRIAVWTWPVWVYVSITGVLGVRDALSLAGGVARHSWRCGFVAGHEKGHAARLAFALTLPARSALGCPFCAQDRGAASVLVVVISLLPLLLAAGIWAQVRRIERSGAEQGD